MPRQARLDAPGLLQHVMARGIERREIFKDDQDRKVPEVGGQKSENIQGQYQGNDNKFSQRAQSV